MKTDDQIKLTVETPHVVAVGISDTGLVRSHNEDAILLDESGAYLLLADGMGGHERGEEASQTALSVIEAYFHPEVVLEKLMDITKVEGVPTEIVCLSSLISEAIDEANSILYARNQKAQLKKFMGTTIVGLLPVTKGDYMVWFHVGDSRLYRWRESKLERMTTDHSAYNAWIRKGRPGDEPSKNVITRAIGPNPASSADIGWGKWQKDDIYFMCSDGLTDMITEDQIAEILTACNSVDDIATQLIDRAKDAGGKDNTSVIVCQV